MLVVTGRPQTAASGIPSVGVTSFRQAPKGAYPVLAELKQLTTEGSEHTDNHCVIPYFRRVLGGEIISGKKIAVGLKFNACERQPAR